MLAFPCTFIKTISSQSAESMTDGVMFGGSVFFVHPYHCEHQLGEEVKKTGFIMCIGHVQKYPEGTPLLIKYNENEYTPGTPLAISSCVEYVKDAEEGSSFVNKVIFNGKKQSASDAIIRKTGKDIFSFAMRKNAVKKLTETGWVSEQKSKEFISYLRCIVERRRLIEFIVSYGGTAAQAVHFYNEYGEDSARLLKTNPYLLRFSGVPFSVYDKMPVDYTRNEVLNHRAGAILYEVIKTSEKSGNTFITLHEFLEKSIYLAKRGNKNAPEISRFEMAAMLAKKKDFYVWQESLNQQKELIIYRKGTFAEEEKSAKNVYRLMQTAKPCEFSINDIKATERALGIKYAEEQQEAFNLFDRSGIAILTGGPGTGKTTVVNGMIRCYRNKFPNHKIALCAPTAAAAKRIRESTGEKALTIHKLLDIQPTGYGGYTSKNEHNQLEYDLIIADEASMIDLSLFCLLVSAVKDGATLLLLGDKDQLSSVGYGDVLHDLINVQEIKKTHLNKIFRQGEQSSIVMNSIAIKDNAPDKVKEDEETVIISCSLTEEMTNQTKQCMKELFSIENPFQTRLFIPARNPKYDISTEAFNGVFQKMFNEESKQFLQCGLRKFTTGDPVVFTKNNYTSGYFNGDTGIITAVISDEGKTNRMIVKTDEKTITIMGPDLYDVSLAYATTVHKSQGSECENAIVVLPLEPSVLLRNDLLYVAATRAKKKNIFIIQEDPLTHRNAFYISMMCRKQSERNSELSERVTELTAQSGEERS